MGVFPEMFRRSSRPEKASLTSISIASPCPADWEKMAGDERVRHCSECNLNVYNLSGMTERQVKQLIAGSQGQRMCLRLYRRADGTILTQDCPWSMRALKRRVSRIAGAVLSAVLSVGVAAAKSKPQQNSQAATQSQQGKSELAITLVDQEGAVIIGSDVTLNRVKGKKNSELVARGSSDDLGRVQLRAVPAGDYMLTAKAKYFKPLQRKITVGAQSVTNMTLQLKIDPAGSVTVEVGVVVSVDAALVQTDAQVTNTREGTLLQHPPIGITSRPPQPLRH
jgi:hypothetical protein